jgi:hypothetical protein
MREAEHPEDEPDDDGDETEDVSIELARRPCHRGDGTIEEATACASARVCTDREDLRVELRRFKRAPIDCPVLFALAPDGVFHDGVAVDVSVGGMFIQAAAPAAFGAAIRIRLTVGARSSELVLPATVRWTRPDGMGVQFGLLGARETFAITELVRQSELARAALASS